MAARIEPAALQAIYSRLLEAYGPQHWWPAASRFEILIGAVLTQNTAWVNVEQAMAKLRERDWLDAPTLWRVPELELAQAIRPSGYFNIKARRLQALCRWFVEAGGFAGLDDLDTAVLRGELLEVKGVGRETADAILLYAFERPVFVVDAYTFRLFERLGWQQGAADYETTRAAVESCAPGDVSFFNELHALIVAHGKQSCRPRPLCEDCELLELCPGGQREVVRRQSV